MPVVRLQPLAAATFFLGALGPQCSGETRHWWRVLAVVDVGFISPRLVTLLVIFIGDESIIYSSTVIQPSLIRVSSIKHMGIWLTDDGWLMIVWGILHYTTLYYIILSPVYLGMIVAELGIPFLTHDLGDPIHETDAQFRCWILDLPFERWFSMLNYRPQGPCWWILL